VAMSRVSDPSGLYVLLPETSSKTTNIVWPEILEDLHYGRLLVIVFVYRSFTGKVISLQTSLRTQIYSRLLYGSGNRPLSSATIRYDPLITSYKIFSRNPPVGQSLIVLIQLHTLAGDPLGD